MHEKSHPHQDHSSGAPGQPMEDFAAHHPHDDDKRLPGEDVPASGWQGNETCRHESCIVETHNCPSCGGALGWNTKRYLLRAEDPQTMILRICPQCGWGMLTVIDDSVDVPMLDVYLDNDETSED